jgi:hypothetical protein
MSEEISVDVFKFQATVAKVTTMVDGSLRLVLDLPETAISVASEMMKVKRDGEVLECAVIPIPAEKAKRWRDQQD